MPYSLDPPLPEHALAARGLALRLLDERAVERPASPSLLSSAYGTIASVLIAIPSWIVRYERQPEIRGTAAAVRSLLKQLPGSTSLVLLTHDESVDPLRAWLRDMGLTSRAETIAASNRMRFGSWAQDGFAVCVDAADSRHYLIQPLPHRSPDDAHAVRMVARSLRVTLTQAPLCFEGGNMLVGDDFWFLGMDSAVQTCRLGLVARDAGESERDALQRAFAERLDTERQLHFVGSRIPVPGFAHAALTKKVTIRRKTWEELMYRGNRAGTAQPMFHIDSFITLAGRDDRGSRTVLVGDPAMASDLLGTETQNHAMQPVFDDIAEQLDVMGFAVVRNPLPLLFDDDEINRIRSWYFASSNNALVEITDRSKRVWIPTYESEHHPELATTDGVNSEIWNRLGFDVFRLGDFHGFARNLGAAHCVTKCLARGT